MVKGIFKVAIRSLFFKHRLYTFSLIFGFTLSLVSSFIILVYLIHEYQFDSNHKNYKLIFRLLMNDPISQKTGLITFHQIPQKLESFSEVSLSTHLYTKKKIYLINHEPTSVSTLVENSIYADENLLKIFNFKILAGNPSKLLSEPYNIILAKELAEKIFNSIDVIGKSLEIDRHQYQITGILDNIPSNSHLQFSLLISKASLPKSEFPLEYPGLTYVLLTDEKSSLELEDKLEKYQKEFLPNASETNFEKPFRLEPLKEVYFSGYKIPLSFSNILLVRELKSLNALLIIAILILLLSIFNYANYSQSRTIFQIKNNFIRRVFGASLISRWIQFIIESLIILNLSFFISIFLIYILLPIFNDLVNSRITWSYIFQIRVIGLLMSIIALISVLLGTFSYILDSRLSLSSFSTGKVTISKGRMTLLNSIFFIQVIGSLCITSFTLIVFKQINFIKNFDPGYTFTNSMEINLNNLPEGYNPQILKNEINSLPNVISSTVCSGNPMSGRWKSSLKVGDSKIELSSYYGDIDFIKTLNIKLVDGRVFSDEILTDTASILINETGMRVLNLDSILEPGDNKVKLPGKIIGVFKDIAYNNLKEQVGPTIIGYQSYKTLDFDGGKLIIRVNHLNEEFINSVKNKWKDVIKDIPFEYSIIEEKFKALHQEEFKEGKLFMTGSIVCIFLCLFGLVGLSALISQKKVREIAIRKVLGATTTELTINYIFRLVKVIFISSILSIAPIMIISQEWLSKFTYKESGYLTPILIAFVILCLTSLLVTFYQILMATTKNPTESLKYE